MAERGILMSAPMVMALLREVERPGSGKTQTRRILKLPKWASQNPLDVEIDDDGKPQTTCAATGYINPIPVRHKGKNMDTLAFLGLAKPTEKVDMSRKDLCVSYAADDTQAVEENGFNLAWIWEKPIIQSMFMPRAFSRLKLTVTGVTVERLHEITEQEAIAEGLKGITKDGKLVKYGIPDRDGFPGTEDHGWQWIYWCADPRDAYAKLWDRLHGEGAWAENPWIEAVSFTVEKPMSAKPICQTGKICYLTPAAAGKECSALKARGRTNLNVYKCEVCKNWHLGRGKKMRRAKRRALRLTHQELFSDA